MIDPVVNKSLPYGVPNLCSKRYHRVLETVQYLNNIKDSIGT